MTPDRICRRGHKVTGENKLERGAYSVCRACLNMKRRELFANNQRKKLAGKIELSEDVVFLLQNPDSLPNWDGIKAWILRTFGRSQDNARLK